MFCLVVGCESEIFENGKRFGVVGSVTGTMIRERGDI